MERLLVSKHQAEVFAEAYGNLALQEILQAKTESARYDAKQAATFAFAYYGIEYREGDEREEYQVDDGIAYGVKPINRNSYSSLKGFFEVD